LVIDVAMELAIVLVTILSSILGHSILVLVLHGHSFLKDRQRVGKLVLNVGKVLAIIIILNRSKVYR
ncbi:hypothetical protein B0O80DRAFT_475269, partial [Mortierella sp. GBAus27b]